MGREIRKVTPNYEHPKNSRGYEPLYDDFEKDLAEYEQHIKDKGLRDAVGYYGGGPSPESYMLVDYKAESDGGDGCYYGATEEERSWFQVFETVSEGTPVSPPFATEDELIDYLVENGDFWCQKRPDENPPSREAATNFVKGGWSPSMIITNGVMKSGINACDEINQNSETQ